MRLSSLSLLFLLIIALGKGQQPFRVTLTYASTDCSGSPVGFDAINQTASCTPIACTPLISGSGSSVISCVPSSTPVPPNTIVCSTCSYCGSYLYRGTTTCTVTPTNGATLNAISIVSLGKCYPHLSGIYKIFNGCGTDGQGANATYYTSSACTTLATQNPLIYVPCVAGTNVCSSAPASVSVESFCSYASGIVVNGTTAPAHAYGPVTYSLISLIVLLSSASILM